MVHTSLPNARLQAHRCLDEGRSRHARTGKPSCEKPRRRGARRPRRLPDRSLTRRSRCVCRSAAPGTSPRRFTMLTAMLVGIALAGLTAAMAEAAVINDPPPAGRSLTAFPSRDFVSVDGYLDDHFYRVEVEHPASLGGGIVVSQHRISPTGGHVRGQPSRRRLLDGLHSGHPGRRHRPHRRRGHGRGRPDHRRQRDGQAPGPDRSRHRRDPRDRRWPPTARRCRSTRSSSASSPRASSSPRAGAAILRASSAPGRGRPPRLRRAPARRAGRPPTRTSPRPTSSCALGAESMGSWLGRDPAAGTEGTIYEVGAGITGGPQAPCTAPRRSSRRRSAARPSRRALRPTSRPSCRAPTR